MEPDKVSAAETRKVQLTGSSSFIVTLPKDWSKRMGLKRGDRLSITEQPDGSLQIAAGVRTELQPKVTEISVDTHNDPQYLTRVFISKYLAGYQLFRFSSAKSMPMELRHAITSQAAGLIGLEVLEETDKTVEIQDLLSPKELTVEKAVRRAQLVASSMCGTVLNALETRNQRLAEDAIEREPGVDRVYFLILRQLTLALQNPSFLKDLGIKAVEVMDYQMLAKSIERIADHATRIGRIILETDLSTVKDEILQALFKIGREANGLNRDAMKAFFTRDVQLANTVIEAKDKAEIELVQLNKKLIGRKGEGSVNLRMVTDSIERIADYSANMAEIAIDRNR